MQVAIEITGIAEAIAQMNRISSVARNLTPLHRHIGNIIQNSIEQSFEDEKSPFGSTWTPSKKDNGKTLTYKGILSNSFTTNADRNSVTVGTNLVYAAIHQYGGEAGLGRSITLPARPFLPVSNSGELEKGVRGEIMEYLVKKLGV